VKLASYRRTQGGSTGSSYGAVVGNNIVDLASDVAPTLRASLAIEGVEALAQRLATRQSSGALPLASVVLLPPVVDPAKILCVGLNYRSHAQEAGVAVPEHPSIFARFPSSLVGHEQPVTRPRESDRFDYEAELAVIVGRRGRRIPEARAMDYVAGYACLAENSVRDWQRHAAQVTPGKNFDASGAFGPWLVTKEEADPLEKMTVTGRLNGEIVQQGSVADMVFSVPRLISYLSTFAELLPGDVIATGTPAGVGAGRKPPRFLHAGDVFEVEISNLGVLRNAVQDDM